MSTTRVAAVGLRFTCALDNKSASDSICPAPPKANVDKSLAPHSELARDESAQVDNAQPGGDPGLFPDAGANADRAAADAERELKRADGASDRCIRVTNSRRSGELFGLIPD